MKLVQLTVVNIFSLIIVIFQSVCNGEMKFITHKTEKGIFIGQLDTVIFDGIEKDVTRFLGIPYAKPPIKERRFSRPEPYGDFKTVYNATYHRPQCMQTTGYMYMNYAVKSEDCLYLNIYVPGDLRVGIFKRYPVMIYLHGGGFWAGGANAYSGDILGAFNDVVVVTMNYRLSVFGFLSTGEEYSGNYGLWDMKLAIQWVHDHIHEFNGDRTKVTLFGNSAGGAAVQYQAINPQNRGLFQRIITQSGSCFAFWALQNHPAKHFERYIYDVGCKHGEYSDVMHCLRSKNTSELISHISGVQSSLFVPSVDNEFVPEDPVSLSKRQTEKGKTAMKFFSELDLLNGIQNYDGAYTWIYKNTIGDGLSKTVFDQQVLKELYHALKRKYDDIPNVLKKSVIYQYTDWVRQNDRLARGEKLLQLYADLTFFVPSIQTSESHTKSPSSDHNNNSYLYVFSQKPDFAPLPEWLKGATHFMEVPYVFGLTKELELQLTEDYLAPKPFTVSQRDTDFSKIMMKIWTNFAKTGNPNMIPVGPQDYFPTWPPFTSAKQLYLELSFNMTAESVKDHFATSSVAFWENIFPLLMECGASSTSASDIQSAKTWFIVLIMASVHL